MEQFIGYYYNHYEQMCQRGRQFLQSDAEKKQMFAKIFKEVAVEITTEKFNIYLEGKLNISGSYLLRKELATEKQVLIEVIPDNPKHSSKKVLLDHNDEQYLRVTIDDNMPIDFFLYKSKEEIEAVKDEVGFDLDAVRGKKWKIDLAYSLEHSILFHRMEQESKMKIGEMIAETHFELIGEYVHMYNLIAKKPQIKGAFQVLEDRESGARLLVKKDVYSGNSMEIVIKFKEDRLSVYVDDKKQKGALYFVH